MTCDRALEAMYHRSSGLPGSGSGWPHLRSSIRSHALARPEQDIFITAFEIPEVTFVWHSSAISTIVLTQWPRV